MALALEQMPLHANIHVHINLLFRAKLRGPCWDAHAGLGSVQLAPHARSLRLRSRGHPTRPRMRTQNLKSRAELRGPCWDANAGLGKVQLVPQARSLRLRSRGVPNKGQPYERLHFC